MGWSHTWIADSLSLDSAKSENFRIAFAMRLQFRFRVGKLWHLMLHIDGVEVDLWIRNRIEIPRGTTPKAQLELGIAGQTDSEAILVVNQVKPSQKQLAAFRKSQKDNSSDFEFPWGADQIAMAALNQSIVAYDILTRKTNLPVARLNSWEFSRQVFGQAAIIDAPDLRVDEEWVYRILDHVPKWSVVGTSFGVGQIEELSDEIKAKWTNALDRQEQYVFYEFAFESWNRVYSYDFVSALLFSIVALEAAHATFVRLYLTNALVGAATEVAISVIDSVLAQGLFRQLSVTIQNFMDDVERPPKDTINNCNKAISCRNEIVHAKFKNGQYPLRSRSDDELRAAHCAVMAVYSHIVAAIEKRLS